MAFWCTRTLKERVPAEKLIVPYDPQRVKHSAYEMGVGREAYITSDSRKKTRVKTRVPPGEKIVIPPGQFGLLTTREVVTVPVDAIAFISIRAGIKFRGLVNVSGFHVDPGYSSYLTFAVYNAGSQRVVLDQKEPVFMIWFSELDDIDEDPYKNEKRGRYIIDSERVRKIQGEVASPAELKKRIDALQHQVGTMWWLLGAVVGGVLLKLGYDTYQDSRKSTAAAPAVNAPAPQSLPDSPPALMPQLQPDAVPVPAKEEPAPEPASVQQPPAADAKKDEPKPKEEKKPGIAQP
jgi:dCTP deaminase